MVQSNLSLGLLLFCWLQGGCSTAGVISAGEEEVSARWWEDSESYRMSRIGQTRTQEFWELQKSQCRQHWGWNRDSLDGWRSHMYPPKCGLYLNIKPCTTLGGAQKRWDPFAGSVLDKATPLTGWKGTEKVSKRQQLLMLAQWVASAASPVSGAPTKDEGLERYFTLGK